MNYKQLLYFLLGAALGGAAGWYFTREKYMEENKEAIESVQKYYKELEKERKRESEETEKEEKDPYETARTLYAQKEHMFRDYSDISSPDEDDTDEESEEDMEIPFDPNLEDDGYIPEFDDSPSEPVGRPYIIDPAAFVNEKSHYDKGTLLYFHGDGVITNENYDVLDDYMELIGDDISSKFDIVDGEYGRPDFIYIRNDLIGADYEVKFIDESFGE